jgi:hypothetical protein
VVTGAPAHACGVIEVGDQLLSINGESVEGKKPSDISPLIVGPAVQLLTAGSGNALRGTPGVRAIHKRQGPLRPFARLSFSLSLALSLSISLSRSPSPSCMICRLQHN